MKQIGVVALRHATFVMADDAKTTRHLRVSCSLRGSGKALPQVGWDLVNLQLNYTSKSNGSALLESRKTTLRC